jgi:surface protein
VTTHIQGSFPTGDIITYNGTNFIPRQITPTLSLATLPSNLTTGSTFSLAELVTKSGTGVLAYSSSHPSVATVNSSTGLVTLVSIGTTTITVNLSASSDGVYAAATLTREIEVTGPPITLAANGVTIQYTGSAGDIPDDTPLFIQANPRDTPQIPRQPEWFAVVKDISSDQINSYAKNQEGGISYFTPPDQTNPVPFNNIVTTHIKYNMSNLFNNATTFNEDISSWDTSNVTDIGNMFSNATAFDKDISSWDTSNVEYMYGTFNNASAFNKNIGSWNTSKVTRMNSVFTGASAFNQPIGGWITSAATDMSFMFLGASVFNQDISEWDTSIVTNMSYMFDGASAFNQDISSWDVALTPARPTLTRNDFASGSPLALPANSHKLPQFV